MYRQDDLKRIRRKREGWEKSFQKWTEENPERSDRFSTVSDVEIKNLYTPEDIEDIDYIEDIGFPGEFPYTRGILPTMHRGRLWTMRMFSGDRGSMPAGSIR